MHAFKVTVAALISLGEVVFSYWPHSMLDQLVGGNTTTPSIIDSIYNLELHKPLTLHHPNIKVLSDYNTMLYSLPILCIKLQVQLNSYYDKLVLNQLCCSCTENLNYPFFYLEILVISIQFLKTGEQEFYATDCDNLIMAICLFCFFVQKCVLL